MTRGKGFGIDLRRGLPLGVACWMAIAAACILGQPPAAQQGDADVKVPAFEVISVKPDKSGSIGGMIRFRPDGMIMENMPVHVLVAEGYHVFDDQVVGEPAWANADLWDIDAKVGADDVAALEKLSFDERRLMFLQIATERFGLKVHHETRELPVYALVVAKGGVKMTPSKPFANTPAIAKGGPGKLTMARGKLQAEGTTMGFVASVLSGAVGRKVVDRTGLTGAYDFTLTWTPEAGMPAGSGGPPGAATPAPEESGPSIFTAVQEQLGLRLEPTKGSVDVIVVDHIEKPAEN
jgi:uncharacterized protein (TIGR03435 family)